MKFNIQNLKKFVLEANKSGYANSQNSKVTKEKNHSTTIVYKNGDWKMHDNFFGGEPYGGREVIFYKNQPVFIMVYYGKLEKTIKDVNLVYKFLQKVLLLCPDDYPYRGPERYTENNLKYVNEWKGEIESFFGEEVIYQANKQIYSARYIGGLVDQRVSNEI